MKNSTKAPQFALYHFHTCPFCMITRRALTQINLDVELRDINKNPGFRKELSRGGGKTQVPCLRIEEKGRVTWMYESRDIIDYLGRRAAELSPSV